MAKKDAQKYIQMIQDETDPDKIQILELLLIILFQV